MPHPHRTSNRLRPGLLIVLSCLPPLAQPVAAADFAWASGASGDWGAPARWGPEPGVPNASGDTAALLVPVDSSQPNGTMFAVTLDGDYAIDAFTHASPDANLAATARTFTVNGPTLFAGRQITFGGSTYVSNGTFTHNSGILDFSSSSLSGAGDYVKTGGTAKLVNSSLLVPATQEAGAFTLSGACTLGGGFTNSAGSLGLDPGVTLALAGGDLRNGGTLELLGGNTATRIESATGSRLVNLATGTSIIRAGGTATRTLAVGIENHGALVLERAATLNAAAGAHSNTGTITAAGQLLVQDARSFANSGELTSTGGNLSFSGDAASESLFANSGTLTVANGMLLQLFKSATNSGTIAVNQGAATIRTITNGETYPFDHTGILTVAPAASLAFTFIGSGTGQVILRDGATLGGGGAISFTNQAVELEGEWSPGASPLTASTVAFSGAGKLTVAAGSSLQATRVQLGIPTANHGSVTYSSSNNTVQGGFANEAGGTVTLVGGTSLLLHDADFINTGDFIFASGSGTTRVGQLETASGGVFRNTAGGSVTIESGGVRRLSTHSDNSGAFAINAALLLDRAAGIHTNSGTITASGELQVQTARSFDNSGEVTSAGGGLNFVGDGNAASVFGNSGSITARNGFLLHSFKAASNSGAIHIAQGAATIRTAINSVLYPFENSGTITVAPGASLAFDFSGTGTGAVTLRDGAVLGGGGSLGFVNQAVELQGSWSPGASPVVASSTTFNGVGPLMVESGSTFEATGSHFNASTSNHGNFTFSPASSTAHGAFTNEADGEATLAAGLTLRTHDSDFTNRGRLRFASGEAATQITRFNTTGSAGVFRNESGGIVTVEGTGTRRILPNTVNKGTLDIIGALTLDRASGLHGNTGTINASGPLFVQNARAFENSGDVTSSGGELVFGGDSHIASSFVNSGTITAANGMQLEKFRTASNSGVLAISQGTATILTGQNNIVHPFSNAGTLRIAAGATLGFGISGIGTGQATNETGGRITGAGTLTVTSNQFTNRGTIAPGDSIGTLTIGTLNHTSEAVFEIEVAATAADRLEVAGNLGLNGTLRLLPATGYVPAPTHGWVIMKSSGALYGSFAGIEQPIPERGQFRAQVDQGAREVLLSFVPNEPLSFEDFQAAYFTAEQIAGGLAAPDYDFDQDGLSNFLEWIHGLDPTSSYWPVPPFRIVRDGERIQLVFLQSTLLPPDVTMQVLSAIHPADGFEPIPADQVVKLAERTIRHFPNAVEITLGFSNAKWTSSPARFFKLEFSASVP